MNITSIQSVVPLLDCMDHNTGAYANLHVSENVGAHSHQDKVYKQLVIELSVVGPYIYSYTNVSIKCEKWRVGEQVLYDS